MQKQVFTHLSLLVEFAIGTKDTGLEYGPEEDPGVISVRDYNYYKKYGYKRL